MQSMVFQLRQVAILALAVALAGPPAWAQEDEVWSDEEPETTPYVPPPPWKSVEVGNFYLKRRNYRAALSRFQEAAAVDPHYAPAYLGLGNVYDRLGLRQKALEAYRKHLDLLPSSKQAEEAQDVHRAIARLERELRKSSGAKAGSARTASVSPPSAPNPEK